MFELKEASDQLMFLRQFRLVFLLKAARELNLGNLIGKEFTPVKTIARSEGLCPDKVTSQYPTGKCLHRRCYCDPILK